MKRALGYIIGGLLFFVLLEGATRLTLQFDKVRETVFYQNTYSRKVMWTYFGDRSSLHETIFRYDSLLGWTTLTNRVNLFYGTNATHDSFGLRINSAAIDTDNKPIRIVTLGDSFTYGDEVNDSSTYPAQLQTLLHNSKVYNLGVSGYGIDQMLWRLQNHIARIRPHIVIVSPIAEDIGRANSNYFCFFKPYYHLENGQWKLITHHMQSPDEVEKKYYFRSKFLMLLSLTINKIVPIERYTEPDKRQEKATYEMLLQRLHKTITDAGAKPVYCLIPYPQVLFEESEKQKHIHWQNTTRQFCEENKASYFALDSCFMAQVDTSRLKKHGHWKYSENYTIARCLSEHLNTLNLR